MAWKVKNRGKSKARYDRECHEGGREGKNVRRTNMNIGKENENFKEQKMLKKKRKDTGNTGRVKENGKNIRVP